VKARLLLLGCLALVAALGAAGWLLLQPPRSQRVRLPGGGEAELLGVTWGKEPLLLGSPLQRLLYTLLPDEQKERAGCGRATSDEARDGAPVFWVRYSKGGGASSAHAADEHGCRSLQPVPELGYGGQGLPTAERPLHVYQPIDFPRRGRTVRLLLETISESGRVDPVPIGEFSTSNRVVGPFSEWAPEPLPAARRSGPLEVMLLRFRTEAYASVPSLASPPGETRCLFQTWAHGNGTTAWAPVALTLTDATGNRQSQELRSVGRRGSQVTASVPALLPPDEPVWKLRAEFCRIAAASFAPEETWRPPPVRLPASTSETRVERTSPGEVGGVRVRLLAVVGEQMKGQQGFWNGCSPASGRRTFRVWLETSPSPPELRVSLLHAQDERRRSLRVHPDLPRHEGSGQYVLCFDALPGSRSVRLTLGVQLSRSFEFFARPDR
jgi:hypothetical protein